MLTRKGYKLRLKTTPEIEHTLRLFAGHRRFVYNYFLEYNLYRLHNGWPILWYVQMEKWLADYLIPSEEYGWPKAVLQQALKDLDNAFRDAFDKSQPNKRIPRRKKRALSSTFRYPQIRSKQKDGTYSDNLKVDNRRVWLPKIGRVGFYKSCDIHGDIKNVTARRSTGTSASRPGFTL